MTMSLSAIDSWVRPIAEHLLNGLILSAAIFLGSLLVFRLLFREQRWSASTRHRASLLLFFVIAGTPILTALKPGGTPRCAASRTVLARGILDRKNSTVFQCEHPHG